MTGLRLKPIAKPQCRTIKDRVLKLFASLIVLAATEVVRIRLNMFGKYFYNGSWQARSFIKKLGRSLFDGIPQGEKLGHSSAVIHALHFSEVIECRIADLTPHHLPIVEH